MNSYIKTQRNNVVFFAVGALLSAGLLAGSAILVKNALTTDSEGLTAASRACLATMRTNGFSPAVQRGGDVKVILVRNANLEGLVYQSGVLIANCPTYRLKDYCAGPGCEKPGLAFTLTPKS